jgi:hypothetical protein
VRELGVRADLPPASTIDAVEQPLADLGVNVTRERVRGHLIGQEETDARRPPACVLTTRTENVVYRQSTVRAADATAAPVAFSAATTHAEIYVGSVHSMW